MQEQFADDSYHDVAGLCKVASVADIEAQGWSLNPGRYVGVAARVEDDGDFRERLESSMRNWSGSMRRPVCLRSESGRMWEDPYRT